MRLASGLPILFCLSQAIHSSPPMQHVRTSDVSYVSPRNRSRKTTAYYLHIGVSHSPACFDHPRIHACARRFVLLNWPSIGKSLRRPNYLAWLVERSMHGVRFQEVKRSSKRQLCGKLEPRPHRPLWAAFYRRQFSLYRSVNFFKRYCRCSKTPLALFDDAPTRGRLFNIVAILH